MNAEEFSEHMWKLNNYGITMTAVCLGNDLGLLDLLMKQEKPLTSQELADKADMKERSFAYCTGKAEVYDVVDESDEFKYCKPEGCSALRSLQTSYVREWLGCMVAAQIVQLEDDKYCIPSDRHGTIQGATAWGYAVVSWVRRIEKTKECFKKNGPWGNDYDLDDTFWTFFGGFREKTGDGFLESTIVPSLDEQLRSKLESGMQILDLGCGTGAFSFSMAQRYPQCTVTGLDASEKPLKIANDNLQKTPLPNLKFVKGDAHNLGEDLHDKFDLVFFCDCLHDLPDPRSALNEVTKVLKADGKLVVIEVRPSSNHSGNKGDMTAAMFYACSMFCCLQNSLMVEPRIGYGACWGQEEMTKMIVEVLNIDKTVNLPMLHAIYVCSKKAE